MRPATLDARGPVERAGARRDPRLRRPAATRALRRGHRPAGPDEVGADRPAGARADLRARQPDRRREPRVAGARPGDARDPRRAAHPRARPGARARRARARTSRRRRCRRSGSRPEPRLDRRDGAHRRLHPRHLARRQAVAGGELDRARPPPRSRKAGRSRCRRPARPKRARATRIAAALGPARDGLASDGHRRLRRSPRDRRRGRRRRQRPEPHRDRARAASRPDLQLPDRLAHGPAAAPRRVAQVSVEGRPTPDVETVWSAWHATAREVAGGGRAASAR